MESSHRSTTGAEEGMSDYIPRAAWVVRCLISIEAK